MSRVTRKDAGEAVFDCLLGLEPTLEEALEYTGLTAAQWHRGLTYVKEVLAEAHSEPVVFNQRTRRYALASSPVEADEYMGRRINSWIIGLWRMHDGTLIPASKKWDTRRTARYRDLNREVLRFIQMLDWFREDLGIEEAASVAARHRARESAGLNGGADGRAAS